jgi:hypothetical protein
MSVAKGICFVPTQELNLHLLFGEHVQLPVTPTARAITL